MKLLHTIALVGVATLVLTSCFGKTDDTKTGTENTESIENLNGMPSPELLKKINAEAEERQRVAKLDTLTADNLKTQTESKNGKTILKDRRLMINYMVSKKVDSSKELIDRLEEVQSFAKKEGVELNESDILTIIASTDVKVETWDLCGEFKTSRKNLDAKNAFYGKISQFCGTDLPEVK